MGAITFLQEEGVSGIGEEYRGGREGQIRESRVQWNLFSSMRMRRVCGCVRTVSASRLK